MCKMADHRVVNQNVRETVKEDRAQAWCCAEKLFTLNGLPNFIEPGKRDGSKTFGF